ncbi:MAG: hypothetical protein EXS09_01535 [Gemmataceae bacterium]|nr:hypothetical protein [Gemmataceae bacterium]
MPNLSMLFGALLVLLGLVGYYAPEKFGEVGPEGTSPTALIPAALGGLLFLCGVIVALAPHTRKHVMHVAALLGLIGAAGGFMPLMRSKMDFSKASAVSGLMMIVLCCVFLVLCVRSFIRARIARAEGFPPNPKME